ncbi:MAG: glycosyltransferase [Syntrophobacteraceae bacterium]
MRILLSYKFHRNMTPLGFECERALEHLGHSVHRMDVDVPHAWWKRKRREPGEDRNTLLLDRMKQYRPDLLFVLIGYNYLPETLETIKRTCNVPIVGWWVENPDNFQVLYPTLPWYDHLFSFSRKVADDISKNGPGHCHFVNYGTDPQLYHPVPLGRWQRYRYGADLSFLGKFKERRRDYLASVSDMNLGIWGPLWRKELKKEQHALLARVRGTRLFDRKAALLFSASKVNLNINSWATPSGPNLRVFDVLACRSCLLTEYVEELEELFTIGREIDTFQNADELKDKSRFYLRNDSAREQMARQGYEKVVSSYTMSHCLKRIFDIALKP